MSISIVECDRSSSHEKYDVVFHSETIHTTVTQTPSMVDYWLARFSYTSHNSCYLVGLDVEWLPNRNPFMNNPIVVIQLCINRECLVFQILHASFIQESLVFLDSEINTFVDVGIEEDVEKLCRDYSLRISNFIELRTLAARSLGEQEMRHAGLKTVALHVLGKDIEKPRRVTMSRWNNRRLTAEQVQYACIDAFASFEIGRSLYSHRN